MTIPPRPYHAKKSLRRTLSALYARIALRFIHEPQQCARIYISRSAILHNIKAFHELLSERADSRAADNVAHSDAGAVRLAPVLKSNAYGHGLVQVVTIIEDAAREGLIATPPFVVVDSFFEALAVRRAGIRLPLHIIGHTALSDIFHNALTARILGSISFTVLSLEELKRLCAEINKRTPRHEGSDGRTAESSRGNVRSSLPHFHIKIDTGMHRQGIAFDEIPQAIELVRATPGFVLEGLCSHFAEADSAHTTKMEQQIATWNAAVMKWQAAVPGITHLHTANTPGIWHVAKAPLQPICNVARLGFGLYGFFENENALAHEHPLDLSLALTMKAIVTGVRQVKAGETVGYGGTFITPRPMTLATIPLGYHEGIDRRLSNKGFVGVVLEPQGAAIEVPCPIVGRVSMNLTTIDLSDALRVAEEKGYALPGLGTHVIVISTDRHAPHSVASMAASMGTTQYEITAHLSANIKREVVE